jgi:hypothetical protein
VSWRLTIGAILVTWQLMTLGAATALGADPPVKGNFWWGQLGLGAGVPGFVGADLGLSFQHNGLLLSIRGLAGLQPEGDGAGIGEIGLLVGTVKRAKRSSLSIAGGISYVDMNLDGAPPWHGLGVPVEIRRCWILSKAVAIGLSGFINLNGGDTYLGLTVDGQFGRLR